MKLFRLLSIALTAAATQALAQQNPASAPMDDRNPYVKQAGNPFLTYSPFMRDAREYELMSPQGYPAAETREVLFSRARSVISKYQMQRSRSRLYEHIDRLTRKFERSEQYRAARDAEEQTWAAYQAAQASVLARLMNDGTYRANVSLAADLSAQIKNVAWEQHPTAEPVAQIDPLIYDIARTKLGYASRATEVRSAALATDPAVLEAKAKHELASARVRTLRDDFENDLKDETTVLALREEFDANRTAAIAAAAYEGLARDLSRGAVRYAYNLLYSGRAYYGNGYGYYDSYYPYYNNHGYRSVSPVQVAPVQSGYGFQRR